MVEILGIIVRVPTYWVIVLRRIAGQVVNPGAAIRAERERGRIAADDYSGIATAVRTAIDRHDGSTGARHPHTRRPCEARRPRERQDHPERQRQHTEQSARASETPQSGNYRHISSHRHAGSKRPRVGPPMRAYPVGLSSYSAGSVRTRSSPKLPLTVVGSVQQVPPAGPSSTESASRATPRLEPGEAARPYRAPQPPAPRGRQ